MRAGKRTPPPPTRAGVITSLVGKRGQLERVAVYLDGTHGFDLALAVVERAGLHQGDPLDEERQARLLEEDAPYRARAKALEMLAVRDRCRKEVETKLRAAGFSEEIVSGTLSWLRGLGYLDEQRFAGEFVSERLKAGWGVRRIRAELLRKGVEREAVDHAVHDEELRAETASEGLATAIALARKRFGGQLRTDPVTAKRRLAGFLARRGYDWDVIGVVARTLSDEARDDQDQEENEADSGKPWLAE